MIDHIKIADISPRVQQTAGGSNPSFAYSFPIFDDTDLDVYVDGVLKVLATDYTVTGATTSNGGTVTFVTTPTSGQVVTLVRNIPFERTTDFDWGEFRGSILNDEMDYQTAALQELETGLNRTLKLSDSDTDANMTLPVKSTRLGKFLSFDATTGEPVATIVDTDVSAALAAAAAAQAAADTAQADVNTLGVSVAAITSFNYQGTWNAATNTPAITSSTGTDGHYYVVGTLGNTTIDGATDWQAGDWIVFNGATWDKIDNNEPSASEIVTGVIEIATQAEVTAGTDDARAITPLKLASAVSSHAALTQSHGISAFGATLVDDVDAATARTTLGLGNAATGTIGTDVQAYDVNTTKNNVANTFSAPQRGTVTTDNDGSFDMNVTNNFKCTPIGNITLTFTNLIAGQSGYVILDNAGGHTVTKAATVKFPGGLPTFTIGTHVISYVSDGTTVLCSAGLEYA